MRANLSTVENVSIFDTYKHIKALQKSGFQEEQARVIVESLLASRDSDLSKLVTKEVFLVANNELKEEIDKLRVEIGSVKSELKEEIGELRIEIGSVKNELKEEIGELRVEIGSVKSELKDGLAAAKDEVMKWVIITLVSVIASGAGVALAIIFK